MSDEFIRREGTRILKSYRMHDAKIESLIDYAIGQYKKGALPTGSKILMYLHKEGKKHLTALKKLEREQNKRGFY